MAYDPFLLLAAANDHLLSQRGGEHRSVIVLYQYQYLVTINIDGPDIIAEAL